MSGIVASSTDDKSGAQKLVKAAASLGALTVLSKVLGYGREAAVAAFFGASGITDAYFVALMIPTLLFSLVGTVLETVAVPLYSRYLAREHERHLFPDFLWTMFHSVILVTVGLTVAGWAFVGPLVHWVAPGFGENAHAVTTTMTTMLMPVVILLALSSWATGVLNSHQQFLAPALVGLPYNLILIGCTVAAGTSTSQTQWLVAGTFAACASQFVIQLPALLRSVPTYRCVLRLNHAGVRQMPALVMPVVAADLAFQFNAVVDRILASGLPVGSISALSYAQRAIGLWQGLLSAPIITVLYPTLAAHAVEGNQAGFRGVVNRGLTCLSLVMLPIMGGLIVFRTELVRLLYQRGAFSADDTRRTALALLFYAIGLLFTVWANYLGRAFYAMQDSRTPLWTALATVGTNILFNVLIGRKLGIAGLAIATSIGAMVGVLLLLVLLSRKLGGIDGARLTRELGKITAATLCMVVAILMLRRLGIDRMPSTVLAYALRSPSFASHLSSLIIQGFGFGILIVAGGLAFGAACWLLGVEDIRLFINFIERTLLRWRWITNKGAA